jgi:hypothetical protein
MLQYFHLNVCARMSVIVNGHVNRAICAGTGVGRL